MFRKTPLLVPRTVPYTVETADGRAISRIERAERHLHKLRAAGSTQGLRNGPHLVTTLDDGRPLPPVGKVAPAPVLTDEERCQKWDGLEREWNQAQEYIQKSGEAWAKWLAEDASLYSCVKWPTAGSFVLRS